MRVALISDLHGNLVALEAVLADAARAGVDRVVCLGDVATLGPRPREVLARLDALGCACVVGNHDAFMLDAALIRTYTETPIVVDAVDWCRAQLSADELAQIGTFVPGLTVELGGGATLGCYHGTPRSHMEELLPTASAAELDRVLEARPATVLAGGHTHLQMLRRFGQSTIVNPGSVGQPFSQWWPQEIRVGHWAEYGVVDTDGVRTAFELRRVPYDVNGLLDLLRKSDMPHCSWWIDSWNAC